MTNEPAFPLPTGQFWGMSLREHFAALAMQSAFSSPVPASEGEKEYIAMHAYKMADKMLAERAKEIPNDQ